MLPTTQQQTGQPMADVSCTHKHIQPFVISFYIQLIAVQFILFRMTIPLKWNFLFPQLLNDFICKSLCTGYPDGSRIQHSSTLLKWITVNGERTGRVRAWKLMDIECFKKSWRSWQMCMLSIIRITHIHTHIHRHTFNACSYMLVHF